MIGVVTHVYKNGDFDVWFARLNFGATYFRSADDKTDRFSPGDFVACEFAEAGRGTVVAARRAVATRSRMRVTAKRGLGDRPAVERKQPASSGQSESDFFQD
jgi:hypothetical protein